MERTRETRDQPPAPSQPETEQRRRYTPPTVTCYGDVGELTRSGPVGGGSDAMGYESTSL